jgi:pyruvate dehydrogenase E2 component (dihydrolipoyllysine-residue acetyltransferase)
MAELKDVVVPDIGDFSDVPIIEVMVSPGDTVAEEDPLVTLESDKATMDVPSPFAGQVKDLKVKTGDTVSEGSPLLTLEVGGDGAASDGAAAEAGPGVTTPAAEAGAADTVDTAIDAEVAAEVADEPTPPVREPTAPSGDGGGDGAAPAAESQVETPAAEPAGDGAAAGEVYAGPGARRLARELGVDLTHVKGTGRKGRIQKSDVEAAAKGGGAAPAGAPAKAAPATDGAGLGLLPWPQVDFAKYGEIERVPLSRIKKISGPNLHRNWVMIPHVTHYDEADITDLEAFRKQTNEAYAKEGVKVTMVALMVKAVVASLQAMPQFNSSLDGDELVLKRYHNIGFAADTPNGLVVPVIKDADRKGILDIARELTELSGAAREGKLKSADMQGGTFSISSLGGIGGTAFTPLINAPEVAILGVAKSSMKPVWDGSEFRPRLIVPLCLSYDHRVIDGAEGARFCAHLAQVLTDLRRALL